MILLNVFKITDFKNLELTRDYKKVLRATEERIKDEALMEHRIIPEAPRRTKNCGGARRSTTEQNGAVRSAFDLHFLINSCYLFIIFWDSLCHSVILSLKFFSIF